MNTSVCYSSIRTIGSRLRSKEISPVEIVNACLTRIEQLSRLNAFITVLTDEARQHGKASAEDVREGRWRGPVHGVPVAIKDFYDTAGVKTTAAFERFKDRIPKKDAEAVTMLKGAGAIVVGKTNMHQVGAGTTGLDSWFGPVRNPWNERYIPGGSSSGSAVAVAAGMCYATLDTDAIGSCRLPAACCGVVSFKGTYGLIPTKGILEGEKVDEAILWLAHAGITARSVEDVAVVVNVLAERPIEDKQKRLTLGVARNFKADQEVTTTFNAAIEVIRTLGYEVRPADAPFQTPPFGDVRTIEADREAISDGAFKDIDVLLLPTTATTVPTVDASRSHPQSLSAANTMFANYFGLPAISVPCGFDRNGLPSGLQIVGRPWDDAAVLRVAQQYEEKTDHACRRELQARVGSLER